MNTFFCNKCGHAAGQAKETEAGVFCPQCGGRMEREDFQENVQQQTPASRPLTAEAASSPHELKRDPNKFKTASALIDQNIGGQNFLFKPGDRVRYDGQGMDKLGLKAGMEGEVVKCFEFSVDVYFNDLRRVVHLMDFAMRTSLKRMLPERIAEKEKGTGKRRIIRLFAAIFSIILIIAIIIFIIKFKYPEILQQKYFLRYFQMR